MKIIPILLSIIIATAILATLSTGLVLTLTIDSAAGEILTYGGFPSHGKRTSTPYADP